MSSNANFQRISKRSPARERGGGALVSSAVAVAVLFAGGLSAGCGLGSAQPVQSVDVSMADRSTCEGLYVQSIWKGHDLGGAQCQSYAAPEGSAQSYDQRRVQKVCEQTQIRTILSGEPSSDFTQQACASHEPQYQQARLGKACRDISRARTRQQEDLTEAQSAVCKTYLLQPGKAEARVASHHVAQAPRWNGFASVPEAALGGERAASPQRAVPAVAVASAGAPAAAVKSAAVPSAAVSSAAVPSAAVPSAVPSPPAPAAAAEPAAARAPAVDGASGQVARSERALCEDRLVESIWKGEDVTGGAACSAYVPEYRLTRIQNVCEGAQIRSDRTGDALPVFTAQACRAALEPAAAAAAAQPGTRAPAVPAAALAPPGLDEKAIASVVDANWRSIGRDCSAVAPRSRSLDPLNVSVTVTLDVAAAGKVQAVVVRARGYGELERCIEESVRGWVFPAAERGTEVGIPLVFAGQ